MSSPIQLSVRSGSHSYSVNIAEGLLPRLPGMLQEAGLRGQQFVVSSPHVWKLHGASITRALPDAQSILIPDGERFKHMQSVGRVYDALIELEADRSATLIAVGGGVIGDMAGFAAATYLRGITLVHVPTTLLAQVDSAIGGKVGVNHALGKNLIGAFHPPRTVVIDPAFLATLPRREFRAGLYEVIKYGVIARRELFDRVTRDLRALFAHEATALVPVIAESCQIKGDIVSTDERESGLRRLLNFGHTVGHALEAVTRYRRLRHGEAVAYGMLVAADISVARGLMPDEDRQAVAQLIQQMGPLPSVGDLAVADILAAVRRDKKVIQGTLHFVLPERIGHATTVADVTVDELAAGMAAIGITRDSASTNP